MNERIEPVVKAALEMDLFSNVKYASLLRSDFRNTSLFAAQLTSIVSVSSESDAAAGMMETPILSRGKAYEKLNPDIGVLEFGTIKDAVFQVAVTLDPLSETAQKWSTIIKVRPQ
jgi:UDP-glucose:glycoprotein glucosyltransferase